MIPATVPLVGVALPAMLVGALAVSLQRDLDFDDAALGVAVAAARVGAAVASGPAGRLVQRVGPTLGLRVGAIVAAACMLGIGAVTHNWGVLVGLLALSGVMRASTMSSADLWLSEHVPEAEQGTAFAIKQAAPPAAALLAGLSVPSLGAAVGWRWTYLIAGGASAASVLLVPRASWEPRPLGSTVDRAGDASRRSLLVLSGAMMFGGFALGVLPAFLVVSGARAGLDEGLAATLLSVGAGAAVVSRIVLGRLADRAPRSQLGLVALLLSVSAVGFVMMATLHPAVFLVATPLTFATAWGWTGLYDLAIVRANPSAPAAATGMARTGGFIGAVAGPIIFGVVARTSHSSAWLFVAFSMLLSASGMLLGRHLIRRERAQRSAPRAEPEQ